MRVWDVRTGRCRGVLTGPGQYVVATAFCRSGRSVVSVSADHNVYVHDLPAASGTR